MMDFLLFRTFVSHTLIKVFFYLGLAVLFFGYLGTVVFTLATQGFLEAAVIGAIGFFIIVLYGILLRVSSEMMIITFQIHDELKKLNTKF